MLHRVTLEERDGRVADSKPVDNSSDKEFQAGEGNRAGHLAIRECDGCVV